MTIRAAIPAGSGADRALLATRVVAASRRVATSWSTCGIWRSGRTGRSSPSPVAPTAPRHWRRGAPSARAAEIEVLPSGTIADAGCRFVARIVARRGPRPSSLRGSELRSGEIALVRASAGDRARYVWKSLTPRSWMCAATSAVALIDGKLSLFDATGRVVATASDAPPSAAVALDPGGHSRRHCRDRRDAAAVGPRRRSARSPTRGTVP